MKADQPREPLAQDDPRHGTPNAYSNLGCRCTECKAANAKYQRDTRQRLGSEPLPPDDKRHGTENAYTNYRCRCQRCTASHTRARHNRKVAAG